MDAVSQAKTAAIALGAVYDSSNSQAALGGADIHMDGVSHNRSRLGK